jgi:hypothetical protein
MVLRTPPSWLQNGSHPAENDRLTSQALYATSGIIGASSLAITAQGTPNMTVNAAAGWCAIVGSTANSGVYTAYNDAAVVLTITTANASLPRIDRIVVTIQDSAYSGASNTVIFQVLAGTPNASPSAPTTPTNSISLATIAVGAAVTSISAGNITNTRTATTSNAFLPLTGGTVTGATELAGATTLSGGVSGAATFNGATFFNGASTFNSATSGTTFTATSFNGYSSLGAGYPSPFVFNSGSVASSAGGFDYNGTNWWATPNGGNVGTGVIGVDYGWWSNGASSLTNVNTAQNLFPFAIMLPTGLRIQFEIDVILQTGSTAHNTSFTLNGGSGTHTSIIWHSLSAQGNTVSPISVTSQVGTAVNLFAGTSTATNTNLYIRGEFTSSGSFVPRITFSAAPGGTNQINAGSKIRFRNLPFGTPGDWY